jgi:hypothetical protein
MGFEQLPRRAKVIPADEDLPPAKEPSPSFGREVRSAITAIDPVCAKERADDVGLSLAPHDRDADDVTHGRFAK